MDVYCGENVRITYGDVSIARTLRRMFRVHKHPKPTYQVFDFYMNLGVY